MTKKVGEGVWRNSFGTPSDSAVGWPDRLADPWAGRRTFIVLDATRINVAPLNQVPAVVKSTERRETRHL
jgi:hypothetical protein